MLALIAAATYVFTPIVVPGALATVWGPNDKGQIPIDTETTSGIWRHGKFTPLPPAKAGYSVGATGINNSGTIVGVATTSDTSPQQGFILRDGTYTFFSHPDWSNTQPRGIGNSGLVVGTAFNDPSGAPSAGFIYDPRTGVFTDATPPNSTVTIVQGINKFGRIAGSGRQSGFGPGTYAFVWQQQPTTKVGIERANFIQRMQLLEGNTKARGINDAGLIAGFTLGDTSFGYVGNSSLGFQVLAPPGADEAGAQTYCAGLNNLGQVVCAVIDPAGVQHGYIASPDEDGEDEQ